MGQAGHVGEPERKEYEELQCDNYLAEDSNAAEERSKVACLERIQPAPWYLTHMNWSYNIPALRSFVALPLYSSLTRDQRVRPTSRVAPPPTAQPLDRKVQDFDQ